MLVTDGAYREDGSFVPLSFHDLEPLREAFRRAVLAAFVQNGLFTPEIADSMLAWPHSGFHVHNAVRIEARDANGRGQIARCAARAPLSLTRMSYDARLVGAKRRCPEAYLASVLSDGRCVMSSSTYIEGVDVKSDRFCARCRQAPGPDAGMGGTGEDLCSPGGLGPATTFFARLDALLAGVRAVGPL